mgnify:CR=1 FL=1
MENCQKQSLAEDDYYPVKSIFRTGDKVKIEASSENGKYKAKAETRISAPLQIINVDTTYISLRDYNSWGRRQACI